VTPERLAEIRERADGSRHDTFLLCDEVVSLRNLIEQTRPCVQQSLRSATDREEIGRLKRLLLALTWATSGDAQTKGKGTGVNLPQQLP
jgi:hypothetical protein